MAAIAAIEGQAAGFNWSFSPVADLDLHRHNAVVSTRSFGDDPRHVARCVQRYVEVAQRHGLAACAKHWPGDGAGDLDQHHTTSINPLPLASWKKTYGSTFRAAIRAGVLSVMSGHIALPAWPGAARKPASLSRALNLGLLRRTLGFNGVIICDASLMAGLTVHAPREELVPQVIAHGCDMLLFPTDPELDLDYLLRAVSDGRLTRTRVDEAVARVLAMKAALGLHRKTRPPQPLRPAVLRRHARWAEETARGAITLVRDQAGLLPLHPRLQPRLLLVQQENRRTWYGSLPPLQFETLLREAGFAVTRLREESDVRRELFDVAVWVVAEEAAAGKRTLGVPWDQLLDGLRLSMVRTWPELPSVFISLGHPWHVREIEGCPVVINAYSPVPAVQRAVVAALTGRALFRGSSPVHLAPRD
ncbi:MAG: glycoside hydrolase [Betaproteobacteria bacterium]|nr:glycoside hydrolase [Betaproteobacteria bacterium]